MLNVSMTSVISIFYTKKVPDTWHFHLEIEEIEPHVTVMDPEASLIYVLLQR